MNGSIDILIISETKIDETFPISQFYISGYSKPFRLDRTTYGGGILIYVNENIPCKILKLHSFAEDIESIIFEINLHKRKWLLCGGYNPHKNSIEYFLDHISTALDTYVSSYDNILLLGDFNCEASENPMANFCGKYALKNLIKEPTCFKNIENPSSIDVILTNKHRSFIHSMVLETGLSDHHKLTITVLKTKFSKLNSKTVNYRCYNHFHNELFEKELQEELAKIEDINCDIFQNIFLHILEKHAPSKKKTFFRGNESPFMNKTLKKAIMKRSRLKNKYHKENTPENKAKYNRIRNYCVSLVKKSKKDYYNQINIRDVTDNKKFWKTIKPMFTDKIKHTQNISLVDNDVIISDNTKVAEKFNNFFVNIIPNLGITINNEIVTDNENIPDPILKAIKKYEKHPSILRINDVIGTNDIFNFSNATEEEVLLIVKGLNPSKATTANSIPIKIFKQHIDIYAEQVTKVFNNVIDSSEFPDNLKKADITPVHKKGDATLMSNYRPISLLPTLSKLFEKLLYQQIIPYINKYLADGLCGFREGFSAQHCLIIMIEKIKQTLDKNGVAGALLTDLSKAFDCIQHDLLIAKLHAYGFSMESLQLIGNYLTNRKQRTKINSTFSEWVNIIFGVPQGSILGPLLFNIYINDIFLFKEESEITNYADDNTLYVCCNTLPEVIKKLEHDSRIFIKWFKDNGLILNEEKCKFIILSNQEHNAIIHLGNEIITNSKSEKLLGVTIDHKLTFNEHVSNLCNKANQKLHALARVSNYMTKEKLRSIMKAFITSQFGYCPLVWMFHSRKLNNRINKIQERALRLVHSDKYSNLQQLLNKDRSVSIHERNLQVFATELYKVKHSLSPKIMNSLFIERHIPYSLRNIRVFETNTVKTNKYGTETIRYRAPIIWNILPEEIKDSTSLNEFKSKVKHWRPDACACRLCKTFIYNLGFI